MALSTGGHDFDLPSKRILEECFQESELIIERLPGGRNGQVYRIEGQLSQKYVAKFYIAPKTNEKDRLEAEFASLSFLWENGERSIPEPISIHREYRCAIYKHVDGVPLASSLILEADVDQALEFLVRLKSLTRIENSKSLQLASEACFSIKEITANIEERLSNLQVSEQVFPELRKYLKQEFVPVFNETKEWCVRYSSEIQLDINSTISQEQRTLNPSDFGFHNSIRQSDGKIVFLDFEHFGWDDPAKMVSDFLIHPAMGLPEHLNCRFFSGACNEFGSDPEFRQRLELVYPLFGLKWCTILLNEFSPQHLARREFAIPGQLRKSELHKEQLIKARQMLNKVRGEYGRFPYRG